MDEVIEALDRLRRETDSPKAIAEELARDAVVMRAMEFVKFWKNREMEDSKLFRLLKEAVERIPQC